MPTRTAELRRERIIFTSTAYPMSVAMDVPRQCRRAFRFPSIEQQRLRGGVPAGTRGRKRPRPERQMLSDRTVTLIRHRQAGEGPP